jgi:protease-4
MNTFFKVFFGCLLAIVVAGFLGILILFGMAASLTTSVKPVVQDKSILYIDLSQPVMEQGRDEEINLNTFSIDKIPGLHDMIGAVRHAIGDSSIKALYLLARGNSMGMAASQEFGAIIDSFRASGKPVVAYADIMPQRAYEIAHKASHIYAQPGGAVEWVGYHVEVMFFKNLLDKLELKPEIFYAGQFKSATEPFRLTKMSDANRLQYSAFLQSIYSSTLRSISRHRNIDSATLAGLANNLAISTAEQAYTHGMLDGVLYEDQVRDTLRKLSGIKMADDLRMIKISDYIEATKQTGTGDRIAVIYADGSIIGGSSPGGNDIASDDFRAMLAKLRRDDKVKAVVMRINSPGGSAIASEIIWRELELIKKEKPLVVSMGDYAASGGYYIACGADSIFAQPNTLTGSIGVFTIMVDAQKMLNNKLGITFDGVSTNTYSDYGNIARPMTGFEKSKTQRDVDTIYNIFKSRVTAGRKLSGAKVDSIAQGRVWSGSDALKIGLVDKMGGLQDAIDCAARMAKLKKYSTRSYPGRPSLIDQLLGTKDDPNTVQAKLISRQLLPEHATLIREYRMLQNLANHPQARLPFVLQLP